VLPPAFRRNALGLMLACGLLVCSALASVGCSSKRRSAELAPLAAAAWRTELAVPGFGPAVVALPLGATAPRPIAIVLHGGADHPDWQCGSFRGVLGGRVFVLCPRGKPHAEVQGRFALSGVDETAAELKAALAALKVSYGGHVAPSPVLLIGYAEGAAIAAELMRQEPSFFARVALIDGNPNAVTPSATSIFAKGGGKRVLFFCTDLVCQGRAQARATLLTRGGAASKAVTHEVGPWLDARFAQALSRELPWLLEGDARWAKPRR